jgi:hypothetical protein
MRLRTIWTMRGMALNERWHRSVEWFWIELAMRLPRQLKYWAFIDMCNRHTLPDEEVPGVTYVTIVQRASK